MSASTHSHLPAALALFSSFTAISGLTASCIPNSPFFVALVLVLAADDAFVFFPAFKECATAPLVATSGLVLLVGGASSSVKASRVLFRLLPFVCAPLMLRGFNGDRATMAVIGVCDPRQAGFAAGLRVRAGYNVVIVSSPSEAAIGACYGSKECRVWCGIMRASVDNAGCVVGRS